jgi:hypothetical protein
MRWTTRCGETFEELTPDPKGEWVRWEDVQQQWEETTLQALKNSGVDIECGACMETAFTGLTTSVHTCAHPQQVDMADNLQERKES